jgi:hypothetical protein
MCMVPSLHVAKFALHDPKASQKNDSQSVDVL